MDQVDTMTNTQTHIRQNLIPAMMSRRGRTENLTREEIVLKLFSVNKDKPGETVELINEGTNLNPHSASEIADLIYYTYQPNCPDYLKNLQPIFQQYQITQHQAEMFCIIKYEMRLEHGDKSIYKQIENLALQYYLQTIVLPS